MVVRRVEERFGDEAFSTALRQPLYVIVAAIHFVAAIALSVPTSSLWIVGFVVLCPLMMIFMMGGMHGGVGHGGRGGDSVGRVDAAKDHSALAAGSPTSRHALTARQQPDRLRECLR
ncbi:DUF2933 domain-containing protein [Pseudonocardia sp. GCM10023141]|uniref:DUF2933 domain-containing protein n=1 Tax=Pseudonocardia sp. GCM10023141 TaxID=3252653 RepID=UPI003620FDC7